MSKTESAKSAKSAKTDSLMQFLGEGGRGAESFMVHIFREIPASIGQNDVCADN